MQVFVYLILIDLFEKNTFCNTHC